MEKRTRFDKTLDMLLWLSYFGAGSMLSPAFVWGLFNALQESKGSVSPAAFIQAALGTFTLAFTLYAAFRAFHIFTANQKSGQDGTSSTEASP